MSKSSAFMEYIKLHKLNLEQALEDARNDIPIPDDEHFESDDWYLGAIEATEHLLSVATDIMNSSNERYNNDN